LTDFHHIYAEQAAAYDDMVACEDYQGNLWAALRGVRPLDGLDVIEMGAGTGRLTLFLAPFVHRLTAFDLSPHMLSVTNDKISTAGLTNVITAAADNVALPVRSGVADVSIAGWSFGHACGWYPETWLTVIENMVSEMQRVLKPGGTAIIFETLGTGTDSPGAPTQALHSYYHFLEASWGFTRTVIQTDYRFESPEIAAERTRFFFGDALADRMLAEKMTILPEFTGMWHKQV